jgi:hypothetical protein
MIAILGIFRGLWTLVAIGGTAICLYERNWIGAGLWVLSTYLVSQGVFAIARRTATPAIDTDAIADKIYNRIAERVDAER